MLTANAPRSEPPRVLSVDDLTRYLKYVLDQDKFLASVSVRGEISDFSKSPNGHYYFTLKDRSSQVPCVLFRREAQQQRETMGNLRSGIEVIVRGYVTVYEQKGNYQIVVDRVEIGGYGDAHRRFRELKEKLAGEGLFAAERKRTLPPFPRKIALVTSPESQAYHDVLHRLRTHYPFASVIVAGVKVQGEGAPEEMCMAISIVNRLTDADVILLARGGGAPDELAAFNDERLARAIYASRIPVLTGIGHENDQSIADLVADIRAATPSLAATAVAPDLPATLQRIKQIHGRMGHTVQQRVRAERGKLAQMNIALTRSSPARKLLVQRQRADEATRKLRREMSAHLRTKRAALMALANQLVSLDPNAILARGYALLTDAETGDLIGKVEQATAARLLQARVADGAFSVRVAGEPSTRV